MTLSAEPLSEEELDAIRDPRLTILPGHILYSPVGKRLLATIDAQSKVIDAARRVNDVMDIDEAEAAHIALELALTELDKLMEGKDG